MFPCKPKGRRARLNNLWHACTKWQAERNIWHAAFHAVQTYFNSFARPASLYCEENVYIYTHISDCVETVYELPLVPNDTASETFLHKSGAVRSVDRIFIVRMPERR